MANLFEIKREIMDLIHEVVNEDTGEILGTEMDFARLEALEMEQDRKRTYIAQLFKNLTADAEAYKNLKSEYAKKQKRAENLAESLKHYLQSDLDGQKWEAADKTVKISYRAVNNKVMVDDLIAIPIEFFKTPITETNLNKTALKEALLTNKVNGAHLENTVSMTIK